MKGVEVLVLYHHTKLPIPPVHHRADESMKKRRGLGHIVAMHMRRR